MSEQMMLCNRGSNEENTNCLQHGPVIERIGIYDKRIDIAIVTSISEDRFGTFVAPTDGVIVVGEVLCADLLQDNYITT
jgi:hypothetical protein